MVYLISSCEKIIIVIHTLLDQNDLVIVVLMEQFLEFSRNINTQHLAAVQFICAVFIYIRIYTYIYHVKCETFLVDNILLYTNTIQYM